MIVICWCQSKCCFCTYQPSHIPATMQPSWSNFAATPAAIPPVDFTDMIIVLHFDVIERYAHFLKDTVAIFTTSMMPPLCQVYRAQARYFR